MPMKPIAIAVLVLALAGCSAAPAGTAALRNMVQAEITSPEPAAKPEPVATTAAVEAVEPVPVNEQPTLLPPGSPVPGDESDWDLSACASGEGTFAADGSFVCN